MIVSERPKIGPTPGNTVQERLDNFLLRNNMINEAAREGRKLYNCTVCNFWPCEYQVIVCDSCFSRYV